MCDIYGTRVAPHSMPVQLGHLNFEPANPTEAVDNMRAGPREAEHYER